jgi:ribosomal protein S18 acetylase RimI-like enzyme
METHCNNVKRDSWNYHRSVNDLRYIDKLELLDTSMFEEQFFDGWPNPPSKETHLLLLKNSDHFIVCMDEETEKIVGFITAISDGILSAYIPFLEVVPAYKNKGIGSKLVEMMLHKLRHLYMIDLLCDESLQDYYEKKGMIKGQGMMKRNYERQNGASPIPK